MSIAFVFFCWNKKAKAPAEGADIEDVTFAATKDCK